MGYHNKLQLNLMALCCGLALATSSSAEAAQKVLEPSGPWTLDYADEKCRLLRVFGTGNEETLLYFEQFAPSDGAAMTVAGRALRSLARSGQIDLRFGPRDREALRIPASVAELDGYGDALMLFFLPPRIGARCKSASRPPPRAKPPAPEVYHRSN